jgi:hypothetical protein
MAKTKTTENPAAKGFEVEEKSTKKGDKHRDQKKKVVHRKGVRTFTLA